MSEFSLKERLFGFIALMKLRVVELLLITTVPTMVVAEEGLPSLWLIIATLFGGTLAAGGANAINMFIDRDIDKLMERTKGRPLVTGVLSPRSALIFAISIEILAFIWLWAFVNLLSAFLAVAACLFYVFVYSLWLKRSSTSNIVIGGAAGAVPVLIGWSSVTNSLDWPPVILFLLIFLWTPPHFWALAIRYREDYSNANVPMLPVIEGTKVTGYRMVLYAFQVWAISLIFVPVADMGLIYLISAILLGAIFTFFSFQVMIRPTQKSAMRLFGFSISYITILFTLIAVDQLVRSGF
ncbi:MAG: protoheme IX farnesyltransferase [Acidimicrobiaceae bacterium]|nr:protoheme IX farnesyltransferase [Euryarchaeota archaeon]MAT02539.1 protoheme IX farnesyltransferase [Acidimicrobiaceae bacterium]MBC83883.1 protoheme IX farnesyltransferase [Acidimicrobiaceae bacterium]